METPRSVFVLTAATSLAACNNPSSTGRQRVELAGTFNETIPIQLVISEGPPGQALPIALPVPEIEVNTNGGDMTYRSTLTIGDADELLVETSEGERLTFSGKDVKVEYYHAGGLLVVTETRPDGKKSIPNFREPRRWENAAAQRSCAKAAPRGGSVRRPASPVGPDHPPAPR